MLTIFYDKQGKEVGRLEGRLAPSDAPVPGDYTVRHVVLPDDVRAEAQRRMMALVGARDAEHLALVITNGLREATRLLQKEAAGQALTPEEDARKHQLQQVDAAIEAIRAASNRLEAMEPIPEDYADDKYWPKMPARS